MEGVQAACKTTNQSSTQQTPGKKRQPPIRFFREGDYWFFDPEEGDSIGPFDRIYEITMGEWKNEQRELTDSEVTEVLRPYLRPRLVTSKPDSAAEHPAEQPKKRAAM